MLMIENTGTLDREALILLGASTKREDNSKIGFFGSGFKYAIAWLLRNRVEFRIFSGLDEIHISTEPVNFRGQCFDRIVVDGHHTSITTDTGPKWAPQDVLRELIANAKDEGGFRLVESHPVEPAEGRTRIFLEREPFSRVLSNLNLYFLTEPTVIHETPYGCVIDPSPNPSCIYHNGIWVFDEFGKFRFSYDLKRVDLNEERKLRYGIFTADIGDMIVSIDDEKIIKEILRANLGECTILRHREMPPHWKEHLSDWSGSIIRQSSIQHVLPEDRAFVVPLQDHIYDDLVCIGIRPYRVLDQNEFMSIDVPEEVWNKVHEAREILEREGWTTTHPIDVVHINKTSVLGCVHDGTIYLDYNYIRTCTLSGVVSVLLEEIIHAELGLKDCSRELQTYLFDELARRITNAEA